MTSLGMRSNTLFTRNEFETVGRWQFPLIRKQDVDLKTSHLFPVLIHVIMIIKSILVKEYTSLLMIIVLKVFIRILYVHWKNIHSMHFCLFRIILHMLI